MRTTLILTVLNEESTISKFLDSLNRQSSIPDEIIITDGGSTDKTKQKILNFVNSQKNKLNVKLIEEKGNIAKGRNAAIKFSSNEFILCTDAGCFLDKDWVKNISSPFKDKNVDVVSGFYNPVTRNIFEKCLAAYTSTMPDKLNEDFLPSSRSIAFKKSAWKKVKGYPEYLDRCEDLIFAKNLKEKNFKFKLVKNAIVYWPQRKNIFQAFKQFFLYAKGDGQAKYIRPQVPLVYIRYFLAVYILFLSILEKSMGGLVLLILLFISYVIWAIKKNYKYVKNKKAIYILPMLQFAADASVIIGTTLGLVLRLTKIDFINWIKNNKIFSFLVLIYVAIIFFTLGKGAPDLTNPYPYNMDEWHQLQAVRTTVKYGTPNMFGSANGTMFHFIVSAAYLGGFTLIGYINPAVIKINDLEMRERIFALLRINTLIYGVLSIFVLFNIAKNINVSKSLTVALFIFTPIWLVLSGYFKYDIALMFWILLSILTLVTFINKNSNKNYLIAAVPISLAFSVKFSAIPLFLIYFISFFWFKNERLKNIKTFLVGVIICIFTVLLFGVPDTIFGKGNIYHFFYENVITNPTTASNLSLEINQYLYLIFKHYPVIFGHGLYILFFLSSIVLFILFFKKRKNLLREFKIELFLYFSLTIFLISLYPLQIYAGGNRSLVLLPYLVLICVSAWARISKINKLKHIWIIVIGIALTVQIYESFSWVYVRYMPNPQETASVWIENNIEKNETIGLENVPIYQGIPNLLKKEFYFNESNLGKNNLYKYEIINSETKKIPKVIVVTNDEIENRLYINSPKNNLTRRLINEGYKKSAVFRLSKPYYKISDVDYYLSWITAAPLTITVYIK